jgi:hypothetical protein
MSTPISFDVNKRRVKLPVLRPQFAEVKKIIENGKAA